MIGKAIEKLLAESLCLGDLIVGAIELEQRAIAFEAIGSELDGVLVALLGTGFERRRVRREEIEEGIARTAAARALEAGILRHARPDQRLHALRRLARPGGGIFLD